jgi:NADH-quinone oxidoreductase subunit N
MTLSILVDDLLSILPLVVLVAWACMLLLVDLVIPKNRKGWVALLTVLGLLVTLGITIIQIGQPPKAAFGGMVAVDGFAVFLKVLFLGSGLVAVALAYDYLKRMGLERGEYYSLLLFSIGGMLLMAQASNLILVFLSLEWLSVPLYVLAGFARPKQESEESALKYFLLGAFAGGFVVYGIALVYGATATTSIAGIVAAVQAGSANMGLLTVGAALVMIGVGFKVSAVPFHMWTPDVYHGSPSSIAAFMSVAAKTAGFAALLRVFVVAFPVLSADLVPIFWVLAAITMTLGNVVAIAQSNIKRMLAYSSIAHAGYILMSLVTFGQAKVAADSVAAALFYLLAYGITGFGAWAVVIAMEKAGDQGLNLSEYAGLAKKNPAMAAAMTVFMLSFTGIPPTLGFVGKFFLFRTALQGGFVGLSIIGVLTSLISAYYYLRIIVIMYMQDGEPELRSEGWLKLTIFASALAVVLLSLFSMPLFRWASQAVLTYF